MYDQVPSAFLQNELFSGLTEEEIQAVYSRTKQVVLNPGDYLVHEGDPAKELFIILDGAVEVIRVDPKTKECHPITTLKKGEIVGEFALIDQGKRSATVQASKIAHLRSLSFEDLKELAHSNQNFFSIYIKISENLTRKLRHTNDAIFHAAKRELENSRIHEHMGRFLIYVIFLLSLLTYVLPWLQKEIEHVSNTSYVAIPMIVFLSIFVFELIKFSHFPLYVFGITMDGWKKALSEGILFSIPILALPVLVKWILIQFVPGWEGHPLFEPYATIQNPEDHNLIYWLIANLVYCAFVPVQELTARGLLQGLMEQFLVGKRRVLIAIVLSNLMFSSLHVIFSAEVGFLVFCMGLYWGWMYHRTHNLIGVIISHCILGTWFFAVGPVY
jgi:CRP/FNR family cyclic AMP-dependent transcriptional regulator